MSKFSVGDIIVYVGDNDEHDIYFRERFLKQVVREIDDEYHTIFSDSGKSNYFGVDSVYTRLCIKLDKENSTFSNGVPIVWEDVV